VTAYVALIRAVNVAGRKLLMSDLKGIADELGLADARTYIASGNLLFSSGDTEAVVKARMEERLAGHMGHTVDVLIRSADEMREVVKANPFATEPGNKVIAIFLDDSPPADAAATAGNVSDERIALGKREIYVHYPSGMGQSKLRIPAAARGTGRNMNSVAKLAELLTEAA
jgi:uncharacterized protein (DUF1697 family)